MLKDPIVIVAFIALLPALFVVFRVVARSVLGKLMDDRVEITLKMADGSVYRRELKVSRDQDIDKLLRDIASQSKDKVGA